jgi:hypothetical protein
MSDAKPADPDQIREEIEATRADLADTVDALSTKLDVKAQAKSKAHEVQATVSDTLSKAKQSAPPPVQTSLDRVGAALGPALAKAKPYRRQIIAAVGAAAAVLVLARRRGRSK